MAGIYFHIPFCKQACHYCDFHFSTSLKYRDDMVAALCREVALQSDYLSGQDATIETIYFGGGTPSLLAAADIAKLIGVVGNHFVIDGGAEITIESNPDDLDDTYVEALRATAINRFSIGIQSFFEEDLRWMNRAHSAIEAQEAIKRVQDAGYDNITADLIYGYPLLTDSKWQTNIGHLVEAGIPHISAYGMTVEPRTALAASIRKGRQLPMEEEQAATQFIQLMDALETAGFVHYEISNFARPGGHARHNSNYWKGVPYVGVGPSAHSFDGHARQWNVRNNARYLSAVQADSIPYEKEELSPSDKLNEYIMTSLRTIWGLDMDVVERRFGLRYRQSLDVALKRFTLTGDILLGGVVATLTRKGKLFADHIAAELFVEHED
ncbi:radical SAM family heme chaperone HemW [Parapedobacter sp. 10938]|uniref:radical SAM family heme chaperone HemW n=1 Tax=Parapedobacter flavus TaxID=3110225 RepID=UPI002DBC6D15|nr:radical SAM family heme chaperone HemW [Parapedobacter sp. 10938]MEC3878018.1 radical SAM family heme chaperone HemW [Parapedobacter sp. 10938]